MVREFEVGTAKPSAAERARVPHHLVDFVAPDGYITAGEYARQARGVLHEIRQRGHLPIVVGGTGLYLRAVVDGLFPGPQRSEQLRAACAGAPSARARPGCIAFCAGSIRPLPGRSTPMTPPR